jgi:hypothetical protein
LNPGSITVYPEKVYDNDSQLFFVEYSKWEGDPLRWQLFCRQYIFTKEQWEQMKPRGINNELLAMISSREGHPWKLGEGIVNDLPGAVDMQTKEFLEFTVDALNEKTKQASARELLREIDVEYQNRRIDLPMELHAKIVNLLSG